MTFQIFRRRTIRGRRWFWRLKAANHKIVAVGGEGFANRRDVVDIIEKIAAIQCARIEDV